MSRLGSSRDEDENEEQLARDFKPGKRALEVLSTCGVHSGRLAKKSSSKRVHPAVSSKVSQTPIWGPTSRLPGSGAGAQNDAKPQQESPTDNPAPWMFINADGDDDAIVTDEIMVLSSKLHMPRVATCAGGRQLPSGALDLRLQSMASSVLHIKQNDRWSCGFRNLQMMLSSLLPYLPDEHPYFSAVPDSLKRYPVSNNIIPIPLPSLRQVQTFLEQSWADGFDPRGAQHYNRRIVGETSEIGAVEVSCCLSFLNIDSAVVQFIRCKKSRSLLGRFVWAYFTKRIGRKGCCFCCKNNADAAQSVKRPSAAKCAVELLHLSNLPEENSAIDLCSCPVLPLYLQWEGHSVTIVGAEKRVVTTDAKNDVNLLIFDPMSDGEHLKLQLSRSLSSNSLDKARTKFLSSIRLPAHKLLEKDCQILMCSMRALSGAEKMSCRETINAVTAAKSEVVRLLD